MMDLKFRYCFATIFTLLAIESAASLSDLCDGVPRSCYCNPKKQGNSVSLQCPPNAKSYVKVDYKLGAYFNVKCVNASEYELNMLFKSSMFNVDRVETVAFEDCKIDQNRSIFVKLQANAELKRLIIKGASLKNVDVHVLYEYISEKTLDLVDLENNHLEEFPEIFNNLSGLLNLHLNRNLIKTLPRRFHLPKLKSLFLRNNAIHSLEPGVFENATSLLHIDLTNNKITNLPAKLLHPLPYLTVFLLNSNHFQEIPNGFFKQNPLLRDLWLIDCGLAEIKPDIFSKSTQLSSIKLRNNSLRTLPEHVFANLSNLTYLDISSNSFEDLPENVIEDLDDLLFFYVSQNKLTRWSESYNEYLTSLTELYLNGNSLTEIGATTFSGLSKLKILELKRNRISKVHPRAFDDLENLTKLDLSNNDLAKVEGVVDLMVGKIDSKLNIKLKNNHLTHIQPPVNFSSLSESNLRTYNEFHFSQNPIECGCGNYDFIMFLQARTKPCKSRQVCHNEECASPQHLKGVNLMKVNLRKFICLEGCPVGCSCEFEPETKFLSLDCSNGHFTQSPSIPALFRRSIDGNVVIIPDKIQMNLEGNYIEEFKEDISYRNVTILNLSKNRLRRVDWIPPWIEVLNLDNNTLTGLDSNTLFLLNKSSSMTLLTLHDNPWKCDCAMMESVKAIHSNLIKIISNDTITCSDGFPLLELYQQKACGSTISTFLIMSIVVLSLVVLVSIVTVIFYFRYENHVKIWIYNHKLLSFLVKAEDLDQDRTYDAFVSYSHEDEEFVAKCLVPELEDGPEKYKLCLHGRDWVVGEYIQKQIADSVRDSRRTIIVLSGNFLASDWANVEFRVAHEKSMGEERTRLIIILYGDVDTSQISNAELRMYLTTNTYIKWGDPWFWEKLRNTMPSKRGRLQKKSESNNAADVKI